MDGLKKFTRSRYFLILFSLFLIAIDQISKFIVHSHLGIAERWDILNSIQDYFSIVFVSNTGVFFGWFEKYGNAIAIFSVFISAIIVFVYPKINNRIIQAGLILILSGAVGNVIDRLLYGYVIDIFLFANYIVLNIADIYVLAGILVFLIRLYGENKENSIHMNVSGL